MTKDTADKVASWITVSVWVLFLIAAITTPNMSGAGLIFGPVIFAAVAGLIVRLGLGLFVRKS